jgi:hypothetical protein
MISAEAKGFSSSLCVQTGSGAHPASCPTGTGGPFPGHKARAGRDADHLPHLLPRPFMSRSYTSSPPPQTPPWRVAGLLYFTFFTLHGHITRILEIIIINESSSQFFRSYILYVAGISVRRQSKEGKTLPRC